MKWIGLTGGIASGKSTACQLLKKFSGLPIVDADLLSREVMAPGGLAYHEIIKVFGVGILDPDGAIDRGQLGKIVFADTDKRQTLESIVHPVVRSQTQAQRRELEKKRIKTAINDVPLLFEKSSPKQYDEILVVYCHPEQQLQRLKLRNFYSDKEAWLRINSQMPLHQKKALASLTIDNTGTLKDLENSVQEAIGYLSQLAP